MKDGLMFFGGRDVVRTGILFEFKAGRSETSRFLRVATPLARSLRQQGVSLDFEFEFRAPGIRVEPTPEIMLGAKSAPGNPAAGQMMEFMVSETFSLESSNEISCFFVGKL